MSHQIQGEIEELRLELTRQWLDNHWEHCGQKVPPWPHGGMCHCPLPNALSRLPPNEIDVLLALASDNAVSHKSD